MKLENIETATAKNGKIYLKVKVDGKTYPFFGDLPDGMQTGDEVECEFQKKGEYTNLKSIRRPLGFEAPKLESVSHSTVLNMTDKPHSYEFGKASARHKIYYGKLSELVEHLSALKEAGLVEPEFPEPVPGESQ